MQLVDAAEAGKLLSGTTTTSAAGNSKQAAGAAAAAAAGSKPLSGIAAAAAARAAARQVSPPGSGRQQPQQSQQRVEVTLQVTPEGDVRVALRVVVQAATGGRLPGLRRAGFGAGLGPRQPSGDGTTLHRVSSSRAAAGATAAAAAAAAAAAEAAAAKKRKPAKRVSWRDRELVSVRWFIKEDPAVNVSDGSGAGLVLSKTVVDGSVPGPLLLMPHARLLACSTRVTQSHTPGAPRCPPD